VAEVAEVVEEVAHVLVPQATAMLKRNTRLT